jgi:hypothetical protein
MSACPLSVISMVEGITPSFRKSCRHEATWRSVYLFGYSCCLDKSVNRRAATLSVEDFDPRDFLVGIAPNSGYRECRSRDSERVRAEPNWLE